MTQTVTKRQVRAARLVQAIDEKHGRTTEPWIVRVADAGRPDNHEFPAQDSAAVTERQVRAARIVRAIDEKHGRTPEPWITRVAAARPALEHPASE